MGSGLRLVEPTARRGKWVNAMMVKYGQILDEKKLLKYPLIMGILEAEAGIDFNRVHQSMEATFADKNVAELLSLF